MYNVCCLFFLFFIYSVFGFVAELIFCTIAQRKLVLNRGFLIGPYCPIYGVAVVLMKYFLQPYRKDYIVVFALGAIISTVLEYVTSFWMEKIFKTRWWDYTNESFNINGRVCLKNSLLFGVAAVIVVCFFQDTYLQIVQFFPKTFFIVMNLIFMAVMILDVAVSTNIITKLRKSSELIHKDMTSEIKDKVKKELEKHLTLTMRVLQSFPKAFLNIRDMAGKLYLKRKKKKDH